MQRVSLGQYYPAKSVIHNMDGRVRIICALLFMVTTFLCKSLLSFAFLAACTLLTILVSRIPISVVFKSLGMIAFVLAFTFVLNVFFLSGDGQPIWSWWIFKIYKEGIWNAAFMTVRIICLVVGTGILISFTVTPIDMTHSLEDLLSPLKKIGIPVHTFSMMMFIALRFIPTLSKDAEIIMTAQMSRGVDFKNGSLIKRIKALIPILIPLFVSAFRRADDLATAMECRCYHGGEGRTKLHVSKLKASDIVILAVFVLIGVGAVFMNRITLGYTL